jgi:tetratricopeptide (TPR) repeat protein
MRERFVERPHVVSFAGEVAVLASIAASPRRLAWVVPIAALWANLHAGAFVAAWLLAAAAAGTWLDRTAGDERARPAPLLLAAAGAALACLATPVGWGIARYLAFHVGIAAVHPIDEFRAPDLRSDGALFAFAALAFVAAAPWRGGERVALRDVLPAAALALLAARSVRFGADFALVAAPFVAARATRFAARLGAFARWPAGAAALGVATAAVVVAPRPGRSSFGLAADALPLDAIAFVDREGLRDRLYNDLELGGYLAWQGWPRHRVFVDPRLPAYPDELHRLLGRAEVSRAEWDAALARFGVDRALLAWAGVNRRVAWFDPDRWALVYRERDARVFVRRTAAHRALIAAQEIPATFAFSDAAGVATIPLPEPPAGSPVERCEWRLRLGDLLFDLDDGAPSRAIAAYRAALAIDPACGGPERAAHAHAWVGAMLTNDHQPQTALAHLDRVLSLVDPERAGSSTLANRALALEALGRRGEAARAWALVVRHASDARLASAARGRARELLETE